MLRKILLFVFICVMGFYADLKAQGSFKDAQVEVTVTDFKKNLRANEIVIFKSQKNGKCASTPPLAEPHAKPAFDATRIAE